MRASFLAALFLSVAFSGTASAQSPGRLLASNCFQCHGTNGKPTGGGFERLAGMSEGEILDELMEMRQPPASVEQEKELMAVHANGFTEAELRLITKFFAKQR